MCYPVTITHSRDHLHREKETEMDKHNSISQQPGATEEATESPTEKQGLVTKLLAWIARGTEKARKEGSLCGK